MYKSMLTVILFELKFLLHFKGIVEHNFHLFIKSDVLVLMNISLFV